MGHIDSTYIVRVDHMAQPHTYTLRMEEYHRGRIGKVQGVPV